MVRQLPPLVLVLALAIFSTAVFASSRRDISNSALLPSASPTVAPVGVPFITLPGLQDPLPLINSDSLAEDRIQQYLQQGAVILPLGQGIGSEGNTVIAAHSSGTESLGPYRFAFAKLSELKQGDAFSITTDKGVFNYRVYGFKIVSPTDTSELPHDARSTVTLVTCWPVWSNTQRLLVFAELIQRNS